MTRATTLGVVSFGSNVRQDDTKADVYDACTHDAQSYGDVEVDVPDRVDKDDSRAYLAGCKDGFGDSRRYC